ncbi:hypothetical protein EDB81DRAFT_666474 [Dactylonectria macrodidyma]|uniref:Uncharacterized protein n=1 Tax=Dactylonectria macrodidyma TaxID=307937 RepID=A0A9P9IIP7_9HYPO|nr:hypothetical protein EDB81DRAFT_666474 [Dactylonectria macrodidyma]
MDQSSSLCPTIGRPDMYGLGIRIAFYIQWLAAVIIEYFDEDDLPDLRFLGALFSAAATTSLVVQISRDDLEPMDIYITLLLGIGVFFFAMPLHVWRAVTRCNPNLDPFQLSREQHGLIYQVSTFILLATNASVGTWYYTSYLPDLNRSCHQYAFVFGKTDLEDKRTHIRLLHEARTLSGFAVFGVLVAAIELSIKWNKIKGISDFTTVGQLLPFFLSAGIFIRVVILHHVRKEANASDTSSDSNRRNRRGMEDVEIIGEQWPHVPAQTYRPRPG